MLIYKLKQYTGVQPSRVIRSLTTDTMAASSAKHPRSVSYKRRRAG